MALKPETKITQDIIKYIKAIHGSAYHVHGSALQTGGLPDISGEYPTPSNGWVHLRVEVKTPEGVPSERQIYWLRQYWRAGYLVGIVTSLEEFIILISSYEFWKDSCNGQMFDGVPDHYKIYHNRHNY